MSQLIFPTQVGAGISGANRFGFRLPVRKTPSYRTMVQTPTNNVGETRVSLTPFPIWSFELDLAWMRGDYSPAQINSAFQQVVGFFGQVNGAADDWLFFDPDDNGSTSKVWDSSLSGASLLNQPFAVGDSSTATFQLTRSVGGLVDLIQNFVYGYPIVYVGGVKQDPSAYSIDAYGNITFNVAPGLGVLLSWAGQFYFRCRFLNDSWPDLAAIMQGLWGNSSFKFKSILI